MAGHSESNQIKRKKAVTDQRRGARFTKLSPEIPSGAQQARGDAETVVEAALDAGADDMARDGDVFLITGPAGQLHQISERLRAKKSAVQTAEIALIPKSTVKVDGKDAKHLLALIEALEEMDDVAKVSSNFDIDAEALAAATA